MYLTWQVIYNSNKSGSINFSGNALSYNIFKCFKFHVQMYKCRLDNNIIIRYSVKYFFKDLGATALVCKLIILNQFYISQVSWEKYVFTKLCSHIVVYIYGFFSQVVYTYVRMDVKINKGEAKLSLQFRQEIKFLCLYKCVLMKYIEQKT